MFTHGIHPVTDGVAAHRAIEPCLVMLPDVHIECHQIIGVIPTVRAEYRLNGAPWYEHLFVGQSTCGMESIQTHTLSMMLKIIGREQPVILVIEAAEEILEVELLLLPPFCRTEFLL